MAGIDKDRTVAELAPEWLAGLEGEELEQGRRLLAGVVDDWAREADSTPDPEAVLAIQRDSLEARGRGQDAAGRLRALRSRLAERKIDRLSVETYELGKAILEGSADDAEARERGREYLARAEALARELDEAGVPADAPARRELGDAVMDALYAVERKAMSIRLARDAQQAGPGPPSVH